VNSPPAGDPGPAAPDFLQEAAVRREKAAEPEKVLWRGGYSSKAMIGAWVLSGLIDVVLLTVGIYAGFGATGWLILVAAMLLPWLYHAAVLCYRRMSVSYRLTTQRFIHELGLLRRVNNRIELLDMDDITFEQGLLERLVGVGTIRIGSSDRTDPELVLPGIENVKEVAAILDNARLAERRRRGVHIEQI
jgi:uncharacterized membrane protein YdbT with pleckstrin-like domain